MQKNMILSNDVSIPSIGLGTWQMADESECENSVRLALTEFNYKHIDTAAIYRNEKYIGNAMTEISKQIAPFDPSQIFLTSKVPPTQTNSYDSIVSCFEQSCKDLGRSVIDMYLIHWPGTSKIQVDSEKNEELRLQAWSALEKLYRDKRVRAIGVSNFMPGHLDEKFFEFASIVPMLNSIEYHPLLWKCDSYVKLEQICQERNIMMQAYTPLAQGAIFQEPYINKLSPALSSDKLALSKKLLQWSLMKGKNVIPKSVHAKYLESNIKVLEEAPLADEEVRELDELFCNKRICWDPTLIR